MGEPTDPRQPWWYEFAGRNTVVSSLSTTPVLWFEREQMPVELKGGVLCIEPHGSPGTILARWGIGSVTFEDMWPIRTDEEGRGLRTYALIPACDAFRAEVFNPGPSSMRVDAALSRDVRFWEGMQLPTGEASSTVLGGDEPLGVVLDGGKIDAVFTGDEPLGVVLDGGKIDAVFTGDEPLGDVTDEGEIS